MADMIDYRVKLDPDRTCYCVRKGRPHKKWYGRDIVDEKNLCAYGPYEFLYGKYNMGDDEKVVLYKRHALPRNLDSPFRNIDRIKLITEIFKQKATGDVPGCNFELPRLLETGCLLGYYPLHDMGPKIQLEKKWLAINTLPSQQPLEQIKDYFGEKVAMYFGWLGVYTTFLLYAAPFGFLTYWVSFGYGRAGKSFAIGTRVDEVCHDSDLPQERSAADDATANDGRRGAWNGFSHAADSLTKLPQLELPCSSLLPPPLSLPPQTAR